jgi:hypothetical protein
VVTEDDDIAQIVERSKQREEDTYVTEIAASYDREFERATALFDSAADHTDNFRTLDAETIRDDPRIVMILRYLVKPTISQMKFRQLVGIRSTGNYE